jgi:3',5'-cyclic AMP phosphodiesterase CpdA
MFTLAHITDPHIGPLPRVSAKDLINKRLFGYLSWKRRRRGIHRPEILSDLQRDLTGMAPDHVAITGDLTNIALPQEFEQVLRWLDRLGQPDWITVIPGNHDAYVALPWDISIGQWSAYMEGDTEPGAVSRTMAADDFPATRIRGEIALIGLTTAQATPLFLATGEIGPTQLTRLEEQLTSLGRKGFCRVVLLHHPPSPDGLAWRKRLVDAEAFRSVIGRCGAELVLHGHDHKFGSALIDSVDGKVAVFGVPSASAMADGNRPQSHYHLYGIDHSAKGWEIGVTVRRYDGGDAGFVESNAYSVTLERG